eukprot:Amastigsp_a4457_18.p1 type:complete len:200 gc:universal Amastigsp_a4457_18:298-897(+)
MRSSRFVPGLRGSTWQARTRSSPICSGTTVSPVTGRPRLSCARHDRNVHFHPWSCFVGAVSLSRLRPRNCGGLPWHRGGRNAPFLLVAPHDARPRLAAHPLGRIRERAHASSHLDVRDAAVETRTRARRCGASDLYYGVRGHVRARAENGPSLRRLSGGGGHERVHGSAAVDRLGRDPERPRPAHRSQVLSAPGRRNHS